MNKKIIGILIILLIIVGLSFFVFMSNNTKEVTMQSGDTVKIPDGFKLKKIEKNETILTNNKIDIKIKEIKNNSSLDTFITNYYDKYSENNTIENSSYNIGDTKVVSILSHSDGKNNNHYWYTKKDKIYHIYIYGDTNKTAVDYIINSTDVK